jgi:hypothetical protein
MLAQEAQPESLGMDPLARENCAFNVKDAHIYNLGVRVLISKEEGEFCAHALELDLLGYGKTEHKAISELLEAIRCQISFARFKNDDSLLSFQAPKEYYDKWEVAHLAALKNKVSKAKPKALAIKAIYVAIEDILPAAHEKRFESVELVCA